MRKKKIENLAETIGKGLIVNENKKALKQRENLFLLEVIELMCELEAKANVANTLGINVFEYEEKYITIVKNLLDKAYGEVKSNIIIWWVYESITPDDKVLPLVDENDKEHIIKTPKQLVRFLKRYDGK
jgi:hypothetical protein|tara:strand:- start:462 stop:848 length:387 start_codon:yes stop_codon:yes gene_type:complete